MPEYKVSNAGIGSNEATFEAYAVDTGKLDTSTAQEETTYQNNKWAEQLGYYQNIPELKAAIDAKARWTVGKGFRADPLTTFYLDQITGFGYDTFNIILENHIRVYHIGGDSYSEIIRNQKRFPINLKPLNAGAMKNVANPQGKLIRFEQILPNGTIKKWPLNKIFYLPRNRLADEIHGTSLIPSVKWVIDARNEAMADYRKLLHRNVYPVRVWHLKSDKQEDRDYIKGQIAQAKYQGEDMIVPADTLTQELAGVPANSILDSKAWIEQLNRYFFEACGTPKIVVGNANDFTESSVKIVYLAWEQTIEEEQLFIEEQVGKQLGFTIKLEFPATLQNELLSDVQKDGTLQQNMNQPSQTQITPGEAGQK